MKNFKEEVQDYLTKVSGHTYKCEKTDKYMKVIAGGDKFKVLKWSNNKYVLQDINYERTVDNYQGNAKCVISHQLFLNPQYYGVKYSGIRQTKYVKAEIADILKGLDL